MEGWEIWGPSRISMMLRFRQLAAIWTSSWSILLPLENNASTIWEKIELEEPRLSAWTEYHNKWALCANKSLQLPKIQSDCLIWWHLHRQNLKRLSILPSETPSCVNRLTLRNKSLSIRTVGIEWWPYRENWLSCQERYQAVEDLKKEACRPR